MGRTLVAAQTPIGGSIFRNTLDPVTVRVADGSIYKGLYNGSSSVTSGALVNGVEFPRYMQTLTGASVTVYGQMNPNVVLASQSGSGQYFQQSFTYGCLLAKNSTTFPVNRTENYYSPSADIGGNTAVGTWRTAWGANVQAARRLYAVNYSSTTVTAGRDLGHTNVVAYYYDTVNSAHAWLVVNSGGTRVKIRTTDGINFTQNNLTGAAWNATNGDIGYGCFKPFIVINGSNGCLVKRYNTVTSYPSYTDEARFFRTTDNFASTTDVTTNWYAAGTGVGYLAFSNYNGTTLFNFFTNNSGGSPTPKFSTDFGNTVSNSTCSGATTTFYGVASNGTMQGIGGACLAMASGANASSFMYISSGSYSECFSYYTTNGGQTFTTTSLQTKLDNIVPGISANTYDGFVALSYSGGRWVALFAKQGYGTYALTSTDNGGTWSDAVKVFDWQPSYYSNGSYYLHQIIANGSTFIAVKDNSENVAPFMSKSTDGVNWTQMTDSYGVSPQGSFFETTDYFVVMGRVIQKSTSTVIGFHGSPGYGGSAGVRAYNMPFAADKVIVQMDSAGTGLVTSNLIATDVRTSSVPVYYNSYSTSGSAYGSFEYVRVK